MRKLKPKPDAHDERRDGPSERERQLNVLQRKHAGPRTRQDARGDANRRRKLRLSDRRRRKLGVLSDVLRASVRKPNAVPQRKMRRGAQSADDSVGSAMPPQVAMGIGDVAIGLIPWRPQKKMRIGGEGGRQGGLLGKATSTIDEAIAGLRHPETRASTAKAVESCPRAARNPLGPIRVPRRG